MAQNRPPEPVRLAPEVYQNIQVLKNVPATDIPSSMQFMSSALGVHCDHCHVERAFEKDDKKPKQQAREMMKMVTALNQGALAGNRGVTCYTCHRGSLLPRRTPMVDEPLQNATTVSSATTKAGLELLSRYLESVGGINALKHIDTEIKKGTLELAGGVQFPVEISLKKPDMRRSVVHYPNGDSIEVENGRLGWSLVPGRPLHSMSASEVAAAGIDADPFFLLRLTTSFKEATIRPDKQINGTNSAVVRLNGSDGTPLRLYFDKQSGLLLRLVRYVTTPLGRNPTQIDFSDYRDVSGLKLPFRWTVSQPQGSFSVQLNTIELNTPMDEARFAKPAVEDASGN